MLKHDFMYIITLNYVNKILSFSFYLRIFFFLILEEISISNTGPIHPLVIKRKKVKYY